MHFVDKAKQKSQRVLLTLVGYQTDAPPLISLTHLFLHTNLPAAPVVLLLDGNIPPVQDLTGQLCRCHGARDLR